MSLMSYEFNKFNKFNELRDVMLHHLSYDSEYVSRELIKLTKLIKLS